MADSENKLICIGIDPSIRRTGISVTLITPLMDQPKLIEHYLITYGGYSLRGISLYDRAVIIRNTKKRIMQTVMQYHPNVVGLERHSFSAQRASDSMLNELQGVIKDGLLDVQSYIVVPFPVMISPSTLKKWFDCAGQMFDSQGKKLSSREKKGIYIDRARIGLGITEAVTEDEVEALIICQILSAWGIPDGKFRKTLSRKQKEIMTVIKQEGLTDAESFRNQCPLFWPAD